ncbi:ABC transporter ATP-binding protein [Microvirga lotononidis]|uniref:ATPase component of various ABC-type transport systems with duplicated ATPase domain n=1 Tax=Microvirga lotononidis TaxID=864069 RepID=I4YV76_9HYPH|nr:ATP-binding cassette domain-containing protein [Microvirga lotononidis]EIM27868.1 ATPase component of various ABC-type transport systems with duplicated ATPase domain [Microvirga lotononidis]WQO28003.1 ATP-binding cassette domain-containing protein [Microvirga lotononidis]
MSTNAPLPPDPAAEWRGVEVVYPFAKRPAVGPLNLQVHRGERLLLLGPSGSGKSTLLLTLTGLIPTSIPAEVRGEVRLFEADVPTCKPWAWARHVAQYFQDADQTLCGMRIEDELAFALENRAVPPECIAQAVAEVMRKVGLPEDWRQRRTTQLSGGERQLVAMAAVLVQDVPLFVVDEPTAHLAPEAARRLHMLLTVGESERTILIVDHRLDGLIEAIDRMVVLGRDGTIIAEGEPRSIFREERTLLQSHGIWYPAASALDDELTRAGIAAPLPPLSIGEALAHLDPEDAPCHRLEQARPAVESFVASAKPTTILSDAPALVQLSKADCAPFLGPAVLRGINLVIREGEILGILGRNGAGKSTLGLTLAGLLPLKAGTRRGPPGGYAFQRPESQFTAGTVREELLDAWPKRISGDDRTIRTEAALEAWGLTHRAANHPFELSQGQKRKLALATLTLSDRWPLLVLDEPMAGLDAQGAALLTQEILVLHEKGRTIALITHDMDLALKLCSRSIIVGEGGILADGATEELMRNADLLARAGLTEPACLAAMRWLEAVAPRLEAVAAC